MAQEVKINIATVGAQQATKDTKSLKQQIKELREELVNLDKSTDEYNEKIQELGNLLHQQSEITEQAKKATDDYGQTLSNLSGIASGVVGSITAINGVMNLVGAGNEDAMKAVKTMTSLMGILQGLNALDGAEKAFKGLMTRIKSTTVATKENTVSMKENSVAANTNAASLGKATVATKAQGVAAATATKGINLLSLGFRRLGLAIKAFMMSNPFTLILVAITAIYSIVSNIIDKQRQATEEMRKQKEELRQMNEQDILDQSGSSAYSSGEKKIIGKNYASQFPEFVKQSPDSTDAKNFWTNTYIQFKNALQKMEDANQKYTENYKTVYEGLIGDLKTQYASYIHWYEKEIERINNATVNDYKGTKGERERALKADQELVKKYAESLDKYYIKLYDIFEAGRQYQKEYTKNTTDTEEAARKEAEDKRKQAWQDAKQRRKSELDTQYAIEKTLAKNHYDNQETTAQEYYEKLIEIENKYYTDYLTYMKKYKFTKLEIEQFEATHAANMIQLNKNLAQELIHIWEQTANPEAMIRASELEMETRKAEEMARRTNEDTERFGSDNYYEREFEFAEAWIGKKLTLIQQAEDAQFQMEYDANQRHLEIQAERYQNDLQLLEEEKNLAIENDATNTDFEIERYRKQYEAKLITLEEFQQKENELRTQHQQTVQDLENQYIQDRADVEYQLAETIYQLHENEYEHEVELFNRKMALTRQYLQAFSTMVGGVQGLLTELQGAYEQGSKEYQAIEEANIIMSGITGALQAWQSGMAAAPAPYNLIIAAAMAGISTATTIAALANLKSKKLSSGASGASINVSPYEAYAAETSAELNGNIQDQRVVVVESDITDTVNRVRVAEDEASF